MSRCKKCNIELLDDTDKCPLCHPVLEKDANPGKNMYPNARNTAKKYRFASNLLLFASIMTETVLVYINCLVDTHFWWSFIVGLVLIYGNVIVRLAIVGKSDYRFKILSLTFMAVVFLVGIDFLTGYRGWSVNYILPAGIMVIDLGVLLLMAINRRNWQSYMMIQLLMILLSIVPVVLLALQVIHFPYLAIGAMGLSLFIFLGTLILGDQRARTELKRRFHV